MDGESKTSQRSTRRESFEPAVSPFAVIYDPEHSITARTLPPQKAFINITNGHVKERRLNLCITHCKHSLSFKYCSHVK